MRPGPCGIRRAQRGKSGRGGHGRKKPYGPGNVNVQPGKRKNPLRKKPEANSGNTQRHTPETPKSHSGNPKSTLRKPQKHTPEKGARALRDNGNAAGAQRPGRILLRDSGAVRTRDPQLRRLLLYPTELRNHRQIRRTAHDLRGKDRKSFSQQPPAEQKISHPAQRKHAVNAETAD